MTEIEKQSEKYLKSKAWNWEQNQVMGNEVTQAFQEGAKWGMEHAIEWHDLRENPDDLPEKSDRYLCFFGGNYGYFIMDYETEVKSFGYWCAKYDDHSLGLVDTEFETLAERNEDEVIAWCELPQFKDKE